MRRAFRGPFFVGWMCQSEGPRPTLGGRIATTEQDLTIKTKDAAYS
jgi:hypothetical protein